MNRAPKAPPAAAVGALVAAVGFGVAGWHGWEWYRLPSWSEQDIAGSVELNLALDLSRLPPDSVPAESQERMRAQIRREVEAQIALESKTPRDWTFAGLLMGGFGLLQMLIRSWLARRR